MNSKKADNYMIIRNIPTEESFVRDWKVVEELYMTWEEAKRYANNKYTVLSVNKRLHNITIR